MSNEKYTPKVGDKVRAEFGESVLVGEVIAATAAWLDLDLGLDVVTIDPDGWTFTQIVEPMVFKPLAVVYVRPVSVDDAWDEHYFVRAPGGGWFGGRDFIWWNRDENVEALIRDNKATLLFEGVEG